MRSDAVFGEYVDNSRPPLVLTPESELKVYFVSNCTKILETWRMAVRRPHLSGETIAAFYWFLRATHTLVMVLDVETVVALKESS